jgi:hypothetical protein
LRADRLFGDSQLARHLVERQGELIELAHTAPRHTRRQGTTREPARRGRQSPHRQHDAVEGRCGDQHDDDEHRDADGGDHVLRILGRGARCGC